jgi:hypothetical protein
MATAGRLMAMELATVRARVSIADVAAANRHPEV